ncbi:hypothetical protein KGQ34_01050 [Patescibacteria group bacterium]|nr:hypothetical protein [Patescibacteria group bacterium]
MKDKKHIFIIIGVIVLVLVFVGLIILPFFLFRKTSAIPAQQQLQEQQTNEVSSTQTIDVGIFKSEDNGLTWQAKNTSAVSAEFAKQQSSGTGFAINNFAISDLAFDESSSTIMYLGTKGGGLWKTTNGGDLWKKLDDKNHVLESGADVLKIALNPNNSRMLYIAVFQQNRGRLLKSEDGGESFREAYFTPLERYGVFDAFVDRAGRVFIATGQGGYLESDDQGFSWSVKRWFADGLLRVIRDPNNSRVLYIQSARANLFRSLDYGASWADITPSFKSFKGAQSHQVFFVDPSSSALYLASDFGLLRSEDRGLSFKPVPLTIPPEALPVLSVASSPQNKNMLYISALNLMYKSADYGKSWSVLRPPGNKRIVMLKIHPLRSNVLFVVVSE